MDMRHKQRYKNPQLRKNDNAVKCINILGIILDLALKFLLLPFHVVKAVSDIAAEIQK